MSLIESDAQKIVRFHTKTDLLASFLELKAAKFHGAFKVLMRERSDDAELLPSEKVLSVWDGLIVVSKESAVKDNWDFEHTLSLTQTLSTGTSVPLSLAAINVERVSLGMIGFSHFKRKFLIRHPSLKPTGDIGNSTSPSPFEVEIVKLLQVLRSACGFAYDENIGTGLGYLEPLRNSIVYEEFYMPTTHNNENIFVALFRQKAKSRGLLVVCRGFGDAGVNVWSSFDMSEPIVTASLNANFDVMVSDHIGHSRSDGLTMFIEDVQVMVNDAAAAAVVCAKRCNAARNLADNAPLPQLFVYGESMGGNIALRLLLKKDIQFAGAVLVAPMTRIDDKVKPPSWQVPILRLAKNLFPRTKLIPNKVSDEGFKFAADARKFEASPLTAPLFDIRLATADAVMRACEELEPNLLAISTPFTVVHGKDDRVIPIVLSEHLAQSAASSDKSILKYDNCTHCVDAEEPAIKAQIFKDVTDWLVKHSSA